MIRGYYLVFGDVFTLGSVCVFIFKQKTAYEMRISDWSSDVCSSDLLLAAFQHGVGHALGIQGDSLGGVVVTRNDVLDAVGRVVGIDHGNHRNTQSAGFGDGNLVVAHVDDEQSVGQGVHVFDAADGLVELFQFAIEHQGLDRKSTRLNSSH